MFMLKYRKKKKYCSITSKKILNKLQRTGHYFLLKSNRVARLLARIWEHDGRQRRIRASAVPSALVTTLMVSALIISSAHADLL